MSRWFAILLSLIVIESASADIGDLYTGPREAAMGGACTAITEGNEAIFLNPAAMAGNKGATLYVLNADGQVSTDSITEVKSTANTVKNISPATVNQYMGQNLAAQGTLTPALTFGNFGVSALIDQQFALLVQNQQNPQVLLGYQTTNGVQMAAGFSLLPQRKNSKDDLRIGIGYKVMFRRGGFYTLTQQQIFNLSEQEVKGIIGSFGEGMSGDFGLQYIRKINPRIQLLAGLDWAQMGNMGFGNGGQEQEQNLAVGLGAKFKLNRGADVTLAYDLKYLTQGMEFQKRNHLGFDISLLNVDLYGGINDGLYLSGGASIDLYILKLTALTYEQELDALSGQFGERRYMLSFTFKLPI